MKLFCHLLCISPRSRCIQVYMSREGSSLFARHPTFCPCLLWGRAPRNVQDVSSWEFLSKDRDSAMYVNINCNSITSAGTHEADLGCLSRNTLRAAFGGWSHLVLHPHKLSAIILSVPEIMSEWVITSSANIVKATQYICFRHSLSSVCLRYYSGTRVIKAGIMHYISLQKDLHLL